MHGKGIPAAEHLEWAKTSFPWFEADDADLEKAYYFRMYSYHNHINETASSGGDGGGHLPKQFHYVTEFYPHVPWAGARALPSVPSSQLQDAPRSFPQSIQIRSSDPNRSTVNIIIVQLLEFRGPLPTS